MNLPTMVMPDTLAKHVSDFFIQYSVLLDDVQKHRYEQLLADDALLLQVQKVIAVSYFLEKLWLQKPELLLDLLENENLFCDVDEDYFSQQIATWQCETEEQLESVLRHYRQFQQSRFIFRDINRLCTTDILIRELSWFADACIQKTVDWNYARLVEAHGYPVGEDSGDIQPFVVLGMGKLGAYELNLSSDIDLMFCFPEAGETQGPKKLDNQNFFTKLGQKVIKNLDKLTIDGNVFRVDMRLRPYGQSGSLVLNFDAMELYYEDQGREWERYAMVKARCVAETVIDGKALAGKQLLERLKPFVYRKYTDFSVIQSLRSMKDLINREVRRLGKENDVKLGAGGIREIEFIAQAWQLVYGGRDENLQQRSVLKILPYLGEKNLLPVGAAQQLLEAYFFLRRAEHVIQAIDDEQTQRLPVDEEKKQRFVFGMGYAGWPDFMNDFEYHRQHVREYFSSIVADNGHEKEEEFQLWRDIWLEPDEVVMELHLREQGFTSVEINKLLEFKKHSGIAKLAPIAIERVNDFMPVLLQKLAAEHERGDAMVALLALVEAVLRRTSYLVLFIENPHAVERLIVVAKASRWVMDQLTQRPVLLDELISAQGLGHVPEESELDELLRQQGLRLAADDVEEHMEMLRYFRLAHHLHIVAAEAGGTLPLMKVSDYLSFLADAILRYVLDIAWQQLVEKHGYPTHHKESVMLPEFAIIAYGKLGGLELNHSSDLDLVFLYEADDFGSTDGERPIENRVFFTRLGQRIIHILTTLTPMGRLYEVDMRLRPSGAKGLLVSTIAAFEQYQKHDAWTWEHQALVRARPVTGDKRVIAEFSRIRKETLNGKRDLGQLIKEVTDMRQKMYDNLTPANAKGENATIFHLKHSRGGIVDIEFMVQFCVLAWGHLSDDIMRYTDNIRILEALDRHGLMSAEDAQTLTDAYRAYRSEGHKLALLQVKDEVPVQQFAQQITAVKKIWEKIFSQCS